MTKVQDDIVEVVAKLGPNARQVICSLDGEWKPAPRSQSRQLTASVAMRHSSLIEREWQDGCAQSTYYRLNEDGLRVRDHLLSHPSGKD